MIKQIAWDSGGGYITLTYQGQGNGTIQVESDANTIGTSRSKTIVIQTSQGGVVTKNVTVNQAACPFPVGDVKNFNFSGDVQSVLLPAGSYKLQCWGAQGGSNADGLPSDLTAWAGGKGGYSEGVLTLSKPTTVYVFVGGQASYTGYGGWNGGGGGTGSSTHDSGGTLGKSRHGSGGGATDIALTTSSMDYSNYRTNRSAASLLSRMIVAGGGGGASISYESVMRPTETFVVSVTCDYLQKSGDWYIFAVDGSVSTGIPELEFNKTYKVTWNNSAFRLHVMQRAANNSGQSQKWVTTSGDTFTTERANQSVTKICLQGQSQTVSSGSITFNFYEVRTSDWEPHQTVNSDTAQKWEQYIYKEARVGSIYNGDIIRFKVVEGTVGTTTSCIYILRRNGDNISIRNGNFSFNNWVELEPIVRNSNDTYSLYVQARNETGNISIPPSDFTVTAEKKTEDHTIASQSGYVGGGTTSGGYSDAYKGKQNSAGSNGEFGKGANQTTANERYVAGCGGGGWYGGGTDKSDSDKDYIKCSGGGSGFVNIAANASYRPSGYTGLQLDSGTTTDGEHSFEAPGGGTETGHAGNGYARITRLN